MSKVEVRRILDEADVRLKLKKFKFVQTRTEWFLSSEGFHFLGSGIRPIEVRLQAIMDKLKPTKLKKIRPIMAVEQIYFKPGITLSIITPTIKRRKDEGMDRSFLEDKESKRKQCNK